MVNKTISFEGYNKNVVTQRTESDIEKGALIKFTSDNYCEEASADDALIGICVGYRNGLAAVQLNGYAELTYSGDAPEVGYVRLCVGDNNTVCISEDEDTPLFKVIKVDSTNKTVGVIL